MVMVFEGDYEVIELVKAGRRILETVGDNPDREGLVETPARWARAMMEVTRGLREDAPPLKVFESDNNEMIVQKDIWFYSMCEHHLVPFFGVAHVGYIANGKVVGLSKIARTVEFFAARPQIQEELTSQIADRLYDALNPMGLIVVMEAEHLCMAMRGIKKPGVKAMTSAIRGGIDKPEFFSILKNGR